MKCATESTKEMYEAFKREIISVSDGYKPHDWIFFAGWQAAIASEQEVHPLSTEADRNRELESWQIVAEQWRVNAVDWSRKNAALVEELAEAKEQSRKLEREHTKGINLMLEIGRLADGSETLGLFPDVEKIKLKIAALQAKIDKMEARKDAAYYERNQVVAALCKCFPAGRAKTAIEGWSEDWHSCVYIDLPTGQVTWHYRDSHATLFEFLPMYQGKWDGHSTEEKYARLASIMTSITSERELELLAVIEQMRAEFNKIVQDPHGNLAGDPRRWPVNIAKDALALTTDLSKG